MSESTYLSTLPLSDFLHAVAETHLKNGETVNYHEFKRRAQQARELERGIEQIRTDLEAANDALSSVLAAASA